jgi:hypothetical protein
VEAEDGHARQTVAYYFLDGETLKLSTLGRRLKGRAVERTNWASLCVMGDEKPFPYATMFGTARIRREDIGEDTARLFKVFTGQDAEPQSDEALAEIDRVILEIDVERVLSGYIEG